MAAGGDPAVRLGCGDARARAGAGVAGRRAQRPARPRRVRLAGGRLGLADVRHAALAIPHHPPRPRGG